MRLAMTLLVTAALAGCGSSGSGDSTTSGGGLTVLHTPSTTTATGPASGPLVRICDRSLADEVRGALRSQGFPGDPELRPAPTGTRRLSACDLGPVELSLDNAPDAVQRYQNRIVETTQFFGGHRNRVPRPLDGVGDASLGAAGANWLPWIHQLLSARGKRVLIVSVGGGHLSGSESLAATREISLAVWDRLG
jgi:hypothetical protein